jgi:hypothetical protein
MTAIYLDHDDHCMHGISTCELDEKIGIARIQLRLPDCGISAVVSEYTDADRALTAWRRANYLSNACDFSILFTDGATIKGRFGLTEMAKSLLSLPRIVLMSMGASSLARGYMTSCVLMDKSGSPLGVERLDSYALNQHIHQPKPARTMQAVQLT